MARRVDHRPVRVCFISSAYKRKEGCEARGLKNVRPAGPIGKGHDGPTKKMEAFDEVVGGRDSERLIYRFDTAVA